MSVIVVWCVRKNFSASPPNEYVFLMPEQEEMTDALRRDNAKR